MLEDLECPIERMQAQEPPASTGKLFQENVTKSSLFLSLFYFWMPNFYPKSIFQMTFILIDVVIFQFSILMRQIEF